MDTCLVPFSDKKIYAHSLLISDARAIGNSIIFHLFLKIEYNSSVFIFSIGSSNGKTSISLDFKDSLEFNQLHQCSSYVNEPLNKHPLFFTIDNEILRIFNSDDLKNFKSSRSPLKINGETISCDVTTCQMKIILIILIKQDTQFSLAVYSNQDSYSAPVVRTNFPTKPEGNVVFWTQKHFDSEDSLNFVHFNSRGKLTLCQFRSCRNANEAFNFSPSFKVQGSNSDSGICKFSRWIDGSIRILTIFGNLVQCWGLKEHNHSLQRIGSFKVATEKSKKGIESDFVYLSMVEESTSLVDRANSIVVIDSLGCSHLWDPDEDTHLTLANKEGSLAGLSACNSVPNSRNLLVSVHNNLPLIGVQSFLKDQHTLTMVRHLKYSANGLINSVISPAEYGPCLALAAGNCLTIWGCSMDDWNVSARYILNNVRMSSISALSWHPQERFANIIAFATTNGLVGTHNINSNNPHKDISEACPGSTVYRVAWGPKILFKGSSLVCSLYSVCNGSIYGHGFSSGGFSSISSKSFNIKSTLISLMDPAPTKYAEFFICDMIFELPFGQPDPVLVSSL